MTSDVVHPRRLGRHLAGLVLVLVVDLAGGGIPPALSQAGLCDPFLDQPRANPYGYRLRGERCEGVYVQQVASTTLHVASFTEIFAGYDISSDRELMITWTAPGKGEVRLRAHGLRRKLYYRMDAARPATSPPFRWPVDLLAALHIARPDVGVVGWIRQPVGSAERDVYLPLRVGPKGDRRAGAYTLVLVPGVQLSEVYVSLAAVGQDGRPTTFIRDDEALRYGYYPADRPIDIAIPHPASPGLYYVLIGALLEGGGSVTTEAWFYHPGR